MRLGVGQVRIDPVQGADGHHGVRRGTGGGPALERRRHHLDGGKACQPLPGHGGQLSAELDRGDGQAALRHRHGGLPGAAADLDHPVSWRQPGQPHQVIEHPGRAHRPGAVVIFRGPVKSGPQAMPLVLHPPIMPQPAPTLPGRRRTA
ncbi:MAG: hypothetical protein ABSA53_01785 [Streptosporangiaceae bacterium]